MKAIFSSLVLGIVFVSTVASAHNSPEYVGALDGLGISDIRAALSQLEAHGLRPSDYWTSEMESRFQINTSDAALNNAGKVAYLQALEHLNAGSVNPELLGKYYLLKKRPFVNSIELATLNLTNGKNASQLLESFASKTPHYRSLQQALKRMGQMCVQNQWLPLQAPKKELKLGTRDTILPEIKNRLRLLGYPIVTNDDIFDEPTLNAVNNIQSVLHFRPDGVISPNGKTWKYLNSSCTERLDQIRADLEKLRWFPREFGDRYIYVNLAHSYLTLIDRAENRADVMKTIVGRAARQTPTLSDRITYITVNPFWVVPPTIFREDKLSDLKNLTPWDVQNYFVKNNYEVWDKSFEFQMEPSSINWPIVNERTPIYIRQKPGLHNALGVLKFNLTNDQAIYLHDTNQRELFGEAERQLSSGCVRVERPFDLAEYLLRGTKWNRQYIEMQVALPGEVMSKDQNVTTHNPIPVYMVYQTVTLNNDGVIRFAEDHYGQIELLRNAKRN